MNEQEMLAKIASLEKELEDLKKERIRVKKGGDYFYVTSSANGQLDVGHEYESYHESDDAHFRNNNYFYSRNKATAAAAKMNYILLLERVKAELCPDYNPDWRDTMKNKYHVFYDVNNRRFDWGYTRYTLTYMVFFDSEETAQKACEMLNHSSIASSCICRMETH